MTVLLDTQVLLWSLRDPDRLSPEALRLLENPTEGVLVSTASAWEIATKSRIGKLPGVEGLLADFSEVLRQALMTALPVSISHAVLSGRLDWEHRDPFDRILAAQAMSERVPLVSADQAFRRVAGLDLVW